MVRADRLDAKLLVHNYGHGGTGHSIGWGTGTLAAELAMAQDDRRAAVIGCGTVGLTTAILLQRRGFKVTIYAKSVPPDTTSNMSLAAFTPTSGLISGSRTPEWDSQFRRAAEISYRQLQLLVGPRYGVSWVDTYNFTDTPPMARATPRSEQRTSGLMPPGMEPQEIVLGPGEHPFPADYALRSSQLRIEPGVYLRALLQDFHEFDGHVVVRAFDTVDELMTLPEPVIVNCTGLGSRELFNDQTMVAVKGQLTIVVPQPEVNYWASGGGKRTQDLRSTAMPRSDGIALGTTMERDVWTLEPNEDARRRVVEAAIAVFGAARGYESNRPITTSRAPTSVPSIDSFLTDDGFLAAATFR